MAKWFLLSLTIFLSSCTSSTKSVPDYHATVAASFAYAVLAPDTGVVTPDVGPQPRPKPGVCEKCGGRGYMVHGDGHRSPCPHCNGTGDVAQGSMPTTPECCCENCQCDPCECSNDPFSPIAAPNTSDVKERSRRVVVATAVWCGSCGPTKAALKVMESHKWEVKPDVSGHFQTVDIDEDPELAKKYKITAVPTYIVIVDGKEIRREVGGPRTTFQLGALYHYGSKPSK